MATRKISDAVEELQHFWGAVVSAYALKQPGVVPQLSCVYRSPKEQRDLFSIGRDASGKIIDAKMILTNCDGLDKISKHNVLPSHAIDIFFMVGKKSSWDKKLYRLAVEVATEHNIRWGGDWNSNGKADEHFYDDPHFEVSI